MGGETRGASRIQPPASHTGRSGGAWTLARRQHGVLTRRQLLALGYSAKAIEHRLRAGRLHRVHQGIYALGRPQLSRDGLRMGAVLACGESAFLTHRSAAAVWGALVSEPDRIEVGIPRHSSLARPGIRVRERPRIEAADLTRHRNIPLTQVARTLLDLASELGERGLERAVNEADKQDLIDPEALRRAVDLHPGEPGAPALRRLLDRHTFRLSDSDLEVRFRPIAAAAGLGQPRTKDWVLGFEVDFHWPELRLIAETDGLRYHRTPSQQGRAAVRDQTHTAAGFRVLRFTHWQVSYEPARVRDLLVRTRRSIERSGGDRRRP